MTNSTREVSAMPESATDVVTEARELVRNKPARLSHCPNAEWADFGYVGTVVSGYAQLFARAPQLLKALCDEVERLRNHVEDLGHDFESSSKFRDEHHVLGIED